MMKKRIFVILSAVLFLACLNACNSGTATNKKSISTDPATIAKGEASFNQYCSGCHNFKQDGIGPQLGGLSTPVRDLHPIADKHAGTKKGMLKNEHPFESYLLFNCLVQMYQLACCFLIANS